MLPPYHPFPSSCPNTDTRKEKILNRKREEGERSSRPVLRLFPLQLHAAHNSSKPPLFSPKEKKKEKGPRFLLCPPRRLRPALRGRARKRKKKSYSDRSKHLRTAPTFTTSTGKKKKGKKKQLAVLQRGPALLPPQEEGERRNRREPEKPAPTRPSPVPDDPKERRRGQWSSRRCCSLQGARENEVEISCVLTRRKKRRSARGKANRQRAGQKKKKKSPPGDYTDASFPPRCEEVRESCLLGDDSHPSDRERGR